MSKAFTIATCRQKREEAEHAIMGILSRLQLETGLEIARVEVMMYVDSTSGEPKRRPHAVRIDLAV